jgi:outer membrane murein-binding lipoprotein Lpp
MNEKKLAEYKRKYDIARHHAWAGSVILAIVLAIRIFLETTDIKINDFIIVIIGGIVVIYTLSAVILTYKYRSGLTSKQKIIEIHTSSNDIEKERLKIEKKKVKAQLKAEKKNK